ncbi:MAG: hypothetical protein ICV85_18315 [Tolypothrix sp. T3-bin4]|nr:hypothetical protein [Tolypothrix sp. T3-bin4]
MTSNHKSLKDLDFLMEVADTEQAQIIGGNNRNGTLGESKLQPVCSGTYIQGKFATICIGITQSLPRSVINDSECKVVDTGPNNTVISAGTCVFNNTDK